MDTEIEWEHALAVTHYYWLTGVIEFRLEKDSLYLWQVPSGENASYQLVALFLYVLYVCPQIQMINNTLFVLSHEAQRVYSMFVL